MTGRWCSKPRRGRGCFGGEFQGYLSGRRRGRGCQDFYFKLSSNWCCSPVQRHGWLPPTWDGSWGVSKTRWRGDWQGGFHGGGWMESRSTPRRRRWERRRVLSWWEPTFREGRIRSCSILWRDQFWTYTRRRRGSRGSGWGCGVGDRR